ncbi:outer membrane beta-barrel protein [Sinomicrobium sp. M5D2P9]
MNKPNLQLCCFLFLAAVFLQEAVAQGNLKLNLDAGVTYNSLDYNLSNRVDSRYNGRWGLAANLSLEYRFYDSFFVSGGVSFMQHNFEFERTGSREGWYTKSRNNYLSIPVLVGAYLINNPFEEKGLWLRVAGGAYTGYWLSMNRKGQYPVFSELQWDGSFPLSEKVRERYDFKRNENQLNRIHYGLQGQLQAGYSFGKYGIYASYSYLYGLSGLQKNNVNDRDMFHKTSMINIGISRNF